MKKILILMLYMFWCVLFTTLGQVSLIMNGSFEQNDSEIGDITDEAPLYWCDVNVPDGKFEGKVTNDWWTHQGDTTNLSIELKSLDYLDIDQGDYAGITQNVFIEEDVEGFCFDLVLETWKDNVPWDHNLFSALVMIDGAVIWESNGLPLDSNGVYDGTVILGSEDLSNYTDGNYHDITLAIRSNINISFPNQQYITRWDFVKFVDYCGGLGYLDADLNQDCYVNFEDYSQLALLWMQSPEYEKQDLYEDNIIDQCDLEELAYDWLYNTDWKLWGQDTTIDANRLHSDYDMSGEVDLSDLIVVADNWLGSPDCGLVDLKDRNPETVGLEDSDMFFDIFDFAALANEWGMRDWLYYRDK